MSRLRSDEYYEYLDHETDFIDYLIELPTETDQDKLNIKECIKSIIGSKVLKGREPMYKMILEYLNEVGDYTYLNWYLKFTKTSAYLPNSVLLSYMNDIYPEVFRLRDESDFISYEVCNKKILSSREWTFDWW